MGGEARGYDGGKKVRGRKRHILMDTEGLLLKVKVHSARVPDQDGLRLPLESAGTERATEYPRREGVPAPGQGPREAGATAEVFIYAAMTRLMVRRLARA